MPPKIAVIVAMDEGRVVGNNGDIPWYLPEDLKRVAKLTTGHTVLMGRKTYDSLPEKVRPLPRRLNVVVSRNPDKLDLPEGVQCISDPNAYIDAVKNGTLQIQGGFLWVFGGEQIWKLTKDHWEEIYLTKVKGKYEGDTWFPEFESAFKLVEDEDKGEYSLQLFRRK